jgi:hypothetical protein
MVHLHSSKTFVSSGVDISEIIFLYLETSIPSDLTRYSIQFTTVGKITILQLKTTLFTFQKPKVTELFVSKKMKSTVPIQLRQSFQLKFNLFFFPICIWTTLKK